MTELIHTSTEQKSEDTVKFIVLNPHPFAISTQIRHQTFPISFVQTSLKLTSSEEPPFDHQWGIKIFYNPRSTVSKTEPLSETYEFITC